MKKKREKINKRQPNPLICESRLFTNWTLKLDPMPLLLIVPYKKCFFNVKKKGPI